MFEPGAVAERDSTIVFGDDVVAACAAVETLMLRPALKNSEDERGGDGRLHARPMRSLRSRSNRRGTEGQAHPQTAAVPSCGKWRMPFPSARPSPKRLACCGVAGWTPWGVWEWLKTFGYGDFAKHVVDYPLGISGPAMGLMLNRTAWKSLTLEQKKLHLKQAGYVTAEMALGNFVIKNEATFKEMQATKGVTLIKVDGKVSTLIKKYTAADAIEHRKCQKFGVKDGCPGPHADLAK
jgi:hypothetical protein